MGNLLATPIHRLMDELSATMAKQLMHPNTDPSTSLDHTTSRTKNRRVLAWVKQWDLCVFGKGKGKKRARDGERFMSSEDELGRPQEKVRIL